MAMLFCDSFDHYNIPGIKWTDWAYGPLSITSGGRSGTSCFTVKATWPDEHRAFGYIRKVIAPIPTTLIVGFAFRINIVSPGTPFVWFGGSTGFRLSYDSSFILQALSGSSTTGDLASFSGTTPMAAGQWFYIEAKVTFGGAVAIQLDGFPEASGTLPSSAITGSGVSVYLGCISNHQTNFSPGGYSYSYDDVYINDGTGSRNNDFLGDVQVLVLRPTLDGSYDDFTPVGQAQNFATVNDVNPNGDSSYVLGLAQGDKDTYVMQNVTNTQGVVNAVQAVMVAKKEGAGTRALKPYVMQGVNEGAGPDEVPLGADYRYTTSVMQVNPATNVPWTPEDVNAAEFGAEIST